MILKLNTKEKKLWSQIRRLLPSDLKTDRGDVESLMGLKDFAVQFQKLWCESRGIFFKGLGKGDSLGVYSFHSVNMHEDYVTPLSKLCVLIPMRGKGEMAYTEKNGKISYASFNARRKAIVFDDNKPHSFISRSRKPCVAVIFTVSKKFAKKLT